jgi:GntR family transcriptional regulator
MTASRPRSGPRHLAIAETLRDEIRSGDLPPGTPLPSEARLTARFGVSRGTVRQALASLRSEGLIAGGRGRVPTVRRAGQTQNFEEFMSFTSWARQIGRKPSARTLELTRHPCDADVAQLLEIEPATPVFSYVRLRLLDGDPVLVERATMREQIGRVLLDIDMDGGSVYEQLEARGVAMEEAQHTIAAMAASATDAALLEIPRRSPMLEVRRRVLGPDGIPFEWSRDRYRADAFEITIHNQLTLPRAGVALSAPAGPA